MIKFLLFFKKVKHSFASQGDIVELHITLALLCPLGQTFIEIPVRSKECKHIQCFDLETYLLMNQTDPSWNCPVCNKHVPHDRLVVDQYFVEILKQVGSDDVAESIKMDENGKWEVFSIEFGDHSESDDDDDLDSLDGSSLTKKRPISELPGAASSPAKRMRTLAPPPQPVVIDLTL